MDSTIQVIRIDNSAGVILPEELLSKLGAAVGDRLNVSETADGICFAAAKPDLCEQIMREDREILRALAK